jgi:hypothetical protein
MTVRDRRIVEADETCSSVGGNHLRHAHVRDLGVKDDPDPKKRIARGTTRTRSAGRRFR